MENLPFDTNHPAVKDYLALIRYGHLKTVDRPVSEFEQTASVDTAESAHQHCDSRNMHIHHHSIHRYALICLYI